MDKAHQMAHSRLGNRNLLGRNIGVFGHARRCPATSSFMGHGFVFFGGILEI